MSASGKISLSGLPRAELEALAERLLAENDALRQVIAGLKAEVATLKGVKGRPELKPSGMEKGAGSEPGATSRGRGGRGKAARLPLDEARVRGAEVPPARASRATRISWSRTWCCARTSSASAASAGSP